MQFQDVLYYVALAGFFFLMMRYGCGSHIMGHGHHHGAPEPDKTALPLDRTTVPGQAIDPVCGMTVQTAAAKTAAYQGQILYFCSQKCRVKFEASPAAFVKSANVAPVEQEHHHG